jgi:hypothetical protein
LTDRHEDVDAAVTAIEAHGGTVGRVVALEGESNGMPNCLHPEVVSAWQAKGYSYRVGYCTTACARQGDPGRCPFLASIAGLEGAENIVATKALARTSGFFSRHGNGRRRVVILDEDPVGLLRPPVVVTRLELERFFLALDRAEERLEKMADQGVRAAALAESRRARRIAQWCWDQIARQPANGQPEAVEIPASLRPSKATLKKTQASRQDGRTSLYEAFHAQMRQNPNQTVRNVARDLFDLVRHAAGGTAFVTACQVLFHQLIRIPKTKQVIVLDATGNPELLRPLFAPRPVEVRCDGPVQPAGRVIQFMDFNGPRSYLNQIPRKVIRILDAIGDLHPCGNLVLISHQSCVEGLAQASRHGGRIRTAYFGALRGRNDLEPGPGRAIAAHVVIGSPKTTEEDRRQVALAVYGKAILPFPSLVTVRRVVRGRQPADTDDGEAAAELLWEVRLKGYNDPRMQGVYDHTVTAELTQAADRARVLIHSQAVVYLVTNEPCPRLWFAEKCLAGDYLDLMTKPRADFQRAYERYVAKVKELLAGGKSAGNADVCRALGHKGTWGHRYWRRFVAENRDGLEGERKVRWKEP